MFPSLEIDFYSTVDVTVKIVIASKEAEKINSYKYLGTVIDDKLNWVKNANLVSQTTQVIIFTYILSIFDVDKSILIMFYRYFIKSVLTFCWFYGLNVSY